MSDPISRLLQRRSFRRDVRRALEANRGLYRKTLPLQSLEDNGGRDALAEDIVSWCRDAFGQMHRPYGLDFVTLAVAVQDDSGIQTAGASYAALRPADFYGAGPAKSRIQQTLNDWAYRSALPKGAGGRLTVVLLSWGDLTRDLLLAG